MILGSVVVGDAGRRKRISTESAEDGALRARRRLTRRVSRSGETRADAVAECFAVDGLAFEGGLGGFYYGTHLLDGGGGGFGEGVAIAFGELLDGFLALLAEGLQELDGFGFVELA